MILPLYVHLRCSLNIISYKSPFSLAVTAFAWVKCEHASVSDCESFLKQHKILTRGGEHFGSSKKYVRISLIGYEEDYNEFIRRLSLINSEESP